MTTAITVIASVLIICATILTCKYLEERTTYVNSFTLSETKGNTEILKEQMDKVLQELDEIQKKIEEQNNDSN